MMRTYKVLSVLLMYPEREWLEALDELEGALASEANAQAGKRLAALFEHLRRTPILGLQEEYVALFDRQPAHSLHLFEHVHGESRERGPAMADLISEYRQHGYEIRVAELPDYLPLFLEYLSLLPDAEARAMLGEAIDVIGALRARLEGAGTPYHALFSALEALSPLRPRPYTDHAPRSMERAMKTMGTGADGVEPVPVMAPMLNKRRPAGL